MTRPQRWQAMALGAVLGVAVALGAPRQGAAQGDRHAGYYYPEPTSEIYISRARRLPETDRERRIAFITGITGEQLSRPYPPQYAIFAKGNMAEKMIIVALNEGAIASLYQGRALLAQLTAVARTTQFFREMAVEDYFTFFDLAKLLGFTRITISDGKSYAHRVELQ